MKVARRVVWRGQQLAGYWVVCSVALLDIALAAERVSTRVDEMGNVMAVK